MYVPDALSILTLLLGNLDQSVRHDRPGFEKCNNYREVPEDDLSRPWTVPGKGLLFYVKELGDGLLVDQVLQVLGGNPDHALLDGLDTPETSELFTFSLLGCVFGGDFNDRRLMIRKLLHH